QSGFYAFYDGFSTSGATDVASYIEGRIKSDAEKCGVPQKTDEIKALAKQSGNYEETYLSMLEKLTFIDTVNPIPAVDPSLDVQVTSLEAKAESQWSAGDTVGYQATIGQLTTLTNSPSYSGRQSAYKEYLRGSFIKMMNMPASGGQPTKDIFRQALSGMEKYDGTTWEKSDAGLYGKVVEMDRSFHTSGVHPSQIQAGYDVTKFMNGRYTALVQMESASGLNAYQKISEVESFMKLEQTFLTTKKTFWDGVNQIASLSETEKTKIGTTEQSIHEVLFFLKDEDSKDIDEAQKADLYRSTLMDLVLNKLKSGDKDIDADDVKDWIVEKADDKNISLDKGSINVL
ncbi:MAG: hypothetical protein WCT46_03445, partial [Candidatus Gracilibacteria bacterium]